MKKNKQRIQYKDWMMNLFKDTLPPHNIISNHLVKEENNPSIICQLLYCVIYDKQGININLSGFLEELINSESYMLLLLEYLYIWC